MGTEAQSFDVFQADCPWAKDEFGRDSVVLKYVNKEDPTWAILSGDGNKQPQKSDTTMLMKRTPVLFR